MTGRSVQGALLAATLLAIPSAPAQACHLFDRLCGKPTTTFYAPTVTNYAPACCPQQQVVNYMPQTAYRTVYTKRPVVSYRPTSACDACGRATTVMRPVTSYVTQPQLVPYTTYRPVVTSVARPCCATAPVTATYAPAVSTVPAAAPAPSCCTPSATPAYAPTPTPSLSSYSPPPTVRTTPAPAIQPGTPGSTLQSLQPTPDPTLNGSSPSTTTPNPTFAPNGNGGTNGEAQPQSRMLLPPSSSSTKTQARGLDPQDSDRTTAIPLRRTYQVRQASLIAPAKSSPKSVDNGGWRAASE